MKFNANAQFIIFAITSLFLCPTLASSNDVVESNITSTQPLSKVESQIADQIEGNTNRALATLEKVVNINSGTMNFEGVAEVGQIFSTQLQELGFDTRWVEGANFNRAGHLVATHLSAKSDAPKMLLIGHLDTVFAKEDAFQSFERLDSRFIAGPGITDMKGGDVIIVEALSALRELGLLENINVKVVMTGDEENSGKPLSESKQVLIEAAQWADVALGFEDGDSNINTAVIARRGSVAWELEVKGKAAHSSQIFQPDIGDGAIFETARILNEFRLKLAGKGDLTFNPGLIIGGTNTELMAAESSGQAFGKNNVIAKTARVNGDIRALSLEELNNAKSLMQEIVNNNLAHTSAELIFSEGYPPMAPTNGNKTLLNMYNQVSLALGYNEVMAVNPRNAGAADISFTAGLVDMGLDGLGLMGRGGHTKDEAADITSLVKNTQKAAILIYRLSQSLTSSRPLRGE